MRAGPVPPTGPEADIPLMADVDINVQDRRTLLTATGGESVLAADFPIYNEAEFTLARTRAGVVTALVLNSDYTVSDVGEADGFTITLAIAAAAGDEYLFEGATVIERVGSYTNSNFKAGALNRELDRNTMIDQELRRDVDRALGMVEEAGDSASEAAGYRNQTLLALKKVRGLATLAGGLAQIAQLAAEEGQNWYQWARSFAGQAAGAAARAGQHARLAFASRQAVEAARAAVAAYAAQAGQALRRVRALLDHGHAAANRAMVAAAVAASWYRRTKSLYDQVLMSVTQAATYAAGTAAMYRRAKSSAAAAAASAASLTDDQIVLKAQVFS